MLTGEIKVSSISLAVWHMDSAGLLVKFPELAAPQPSALLTTFIGISC